MPGPILDSAAKITCAYGGQVTLIPKQVKVLVGGKPVLLVGIDGVTAPSRHRRWSSRSGTSAGSSA